MTTSDADLTTTITDFIEQHFPVARGALSPSSELLAAGLVDSLGILDIVEFLEERFDIVIDDEELVPENFSSVEVIVTFVAEKDRTRT